jgi:hypothetical protein
MKRKNKTKPRKRRNNEDSLYVPREDTHSRLQTFSSDIDQQESLMNLKSEVAALKEQIKGIKSRLRKLEGA